MVGMVEDTRGVPTIGRLALEILVAVLIVLAGGRWTNLEIGAWSWELPPLVGAVLTVLWIVWVTNLYNFMDGVNGIATIQGLALAIGLIILCERAGLGSVMALSLSLAGALAGFLPFNFPRATIFMGDVGSLPLGFVFAVLPLYLHKQATSFSFVHAALLLGPFFLDATITLLRRLVRGERIHEAHRSHSYQWLSDLLASHSQTTLIYGVIAALFVAAVLDDVADATRGMSPFLIAMVAVTTSGFGIIAAIHRLRFSK
jgi:Fuc2NAc and GlcNAc transferase